MSLTATLHTQPIGRLGRWLPDVYEDLRALASRLMSGERPGHTLQPTALVHEAYLRLARSSGLRISDRVHAKALAAQTMRRVLVDHARCASFQKRSGKSNEVSLDEERAEGSDMHLALVDLNDALDALRRDDPRRARVVELRFFAGLTLAEVAQHLEISERTVTYDSRAGCAWLRAEMAKADAS